VADYRQRGGKANQRFARTAHRYFAAREMEKVERDLKTVESRCAEDVLQLAIVSGC
jgi:hypothetical protein